MTCAGMFIGYSDKVRSQLVTCQLSYTHERGWQKKQKKNSCKTEQDGSYLPSCKDKHLRNKLSGKMLQKIILCNKLKLADGIVTCKLIKDLSKQLFRDSTNIRYMSGLYSQCNQRVDKVTFSSFWWVFKEHSSFFLHKYKSPPW